METTHNLPPGGLHQWLREQTNALHHQLDHTPLLRTLLGAAISPTDYMQCLAHLHQAHARVEPWLQQLDHARPPVLAAYEPRLAALQHDLGTLALHYGQPMAQPCLPEHTVPATGATALPAHSHAASLYVGIRYVLEGASQGSRFITRRLQQNAPDLLENSPSYWAHQSRMMNHWQALVAHLENSPESLNATDLLAGARGAFSQFLALFDPCVQRS